MYSYRILTTEGIILQTFDGNVSMNDLKTLHEQIKEEDSFSTSLSIVADFRNAQIGLTLEELKQASLFYKENNAFKGKSAILVSRSMDTAKLMIFRDYIIPDFHFSIYSTIDAASLCVGVNLEQYLEDDISVREDVYI